MPIAFALALLADAAVPSRPYVMPPRAAAVAGEIHQMLLAPVFRQDFFCVEHHDGQLDYAGDALGTDCMVGGGLDGAAGFLRLYRTNGKRNADWYGWRAEVLAPVDGVVIGLLAKPDDNVPGTMGQPPAAMLQVRTDDGRIVVLGHVTDIRVKLGDRVARGAVIARVGNNGMARAPHIHVGAYVEASAEPLQIRWDQRAMAALRGKGH
jgi:hypothetical protein